MASQYFGYNRGTDLSPNAITTGTSTGSTDVEVRIDLTKGITRQDAYLILEAVIRYIEDGRSTEIASI